MMMCWLAFWNTGAQCTTHISTYPYYEGFESNNGGWVSGGTASSWAWGHPNKAIISDAGSGNNCWLTGGLSSNSYNDSEDSWLMTPCFDFTTLSNPQVSFKILWETERNFDGAVLEYSLNGGNTWTILGSQNSNNTCAGENWYNNGSIRYLGFTTGWAGTIKPTSGSCLGGDGIGRWATARHTLSALAGQPSVRFRFRFGAGSTCNVYDGFAIDDFQINEVLPANNNFTWECTGHNTVRFETFTKVCQTGMIWDFGDGTPVVTDQEVVTHTYANPGVYTVTLTSIFSNQPNSVSTQNFTLVDVEANVTTPVKCFGETGRVTAQVNSAVTGISFSWNGQAPQSHSYLDAPAGTYSVLVRAIQGCNVSDEVELVDPTPITLENTVTIPSICGTATGSYAFDVVGGLGPYDIELPAFPLGAGVTSMVIDELTAGTWTFTVLDRNQCLKTFSFTIPAQTPTMQLNFSNIVPENCGQGNGSVQAVFTFDNPQGINITPQYQWSNGSTSATLSNVAAGTYSLTVTLGNTCTITESVTIPSANSNMNVTFQTQQPSCSGSNGEITVVVDGGVAPFTYQWSNGATTSTIQGLAPGTYEVLVTDANGCTQIGQTTLTSPNSDIFIHLQSFPSKCTANNGSIITQITSGGQAPFTYLWSNGETTADISGLAPGLYEITITDVNGCTGRNSITVNHLQESLQLSVSTQPTGCSGNTGAIAVVANNGTAPYTYLWSNGATTDIASGLSTGNYSVTVTDANGCVGSRNNIYVGESEGIQLQWNVQPTYCTAQNGSITTQTTGGVPPYTYTWSNGATTADIQNLTEGIYTLHVEDNSGCVFDTPPIEVRKEETQLVLNPVVTDAICLEGGKIEVQVQGGTAPYQYQWSNGQNTNPIANLAVGMYDVTVTDVNGCASTLSQLEITHRDQSLFVTLGSPKNICEGEVAVLSPGIYQTYLWDDGSTNSTRTVNTPGIYSVQVTDFNGCEGQGSVEVTSNCGGFLYFPSAFTPNGDGLNDYFGGIGAVPGLKSYHLKVYNRWGQLVFESHNIQDKWDGSYKGKISPAQTYTWEATYQVDRKPIRHEKGTVILIP